MEELRHGGQQEVEDEEGLVEISTPRPSSTASSFSGRLQGPESGGQDTVTRMGRSSREEENQQVDTEVRFLKGTNLSRNPEAPLIFRMGTPTHLFQVELGQEPNEFCDQESTTSEDAMSHKTARNKLLSRWGQLKITSYQIQIFTMCRPGSDPCWSADNTYFNLIGQLSLRRWRPSGRQSSTWRRFAMASTRKRARSWSSCGSARLRPSRS